MLWNPFLIKKLLKSVICGTANSTYIHCSQLTKSTIAGWKKKKRNDKRSCDVTCEAWHGFFGFALEWNYLLRKKKKKRFQGSFFKRGLHTFSRFWQKNKQNILVERVYVLITISFASWLSFGRWEMGCGLPRSWDFNN